MPTFGHMRTLHAVPHGMRHCNTVIRGGAASRWCSEPNQRAWLVETPRRPDRLRNLAVGCGRWRLVVKLSPRTHRMACVLPSQMPQMWFAAVVAGLHTWVWLITHVYGRATWFLRWGLRHTAVDCSSLHSLVESFVVQTAIPSWGGVVKTLR